MDTQNSIDKEKLPFFSIIIITFNRPVYLKNAINSILDQNYKDFDVIIVNDGSTESYTNIEDYIKNFSNIKYYYKENEERSIARNFAISKSDGEWICFLDDDDIYYNFHLEAIRSSIKENNFKQAFYHTRTIKRHADGSIEKMPYPEKNYQGIDKLVYDLFTINSICIPGNIAKQIEFNKDLLYWEDFEYWLRLSKYLEFIPINLYTHEYILHDNNTVKWNYKSRREFLNTLLYLKKTYRNYIPKHFLRKNIAENAAVTADFEVRNNDKIKSVKSIWLIISNNPKYVFKQHFWGLLKGVISKKQNSINPYN